MHMIKENGHISVNDTSYIIEEIYYKEGIINTYRVYTQAQRGESTKHYILNELDTESHKVVLRSNGDINKLTGSLQSKDAFLPISMIGESIDGKLYVLYELPDNQFQCLGSADLPPDAILGIMEALCGNIIKNSNKNISFNSLLISPDTILVKKTNESEKNEARYEFMLSDYAYELLVNENDKALLSKDCSKYIDTARRCSPEQKIIFSIGQILSNYFPLTEKGFAQYIQKKIVNRCITPLTDDRFQTLEELQKDIRKTRNKLKHEHRRYNMFRYGLVSILAACAALVIGASAYYWYRSSDIDPESPLAIERQMQEGSYPEALKICDQYIEHNPEKPDGYLLKANILLNINDLSGAKETLEKIDLNAKDMTKPLRAKYYYQQGRIEYKINDMMAEQEETGYSFDNARAFFEQAVTQDQHNIEYRVYDLLAQMRVKNTNQAYEKKKDELQKITKSDPYVIKFIEANMAYYNGDYRNACEGYKECLASGNQFIRENAVVAFAGVEGKVYKPVESLSDQKDRLKRNEYPLSVMYRLYEIYANNCYDYALSEDCADRDAYLEEARRSYDILDGRAYLQLSGYLLYIETLNMLNSGNLFDVLNSAMQLYPSEIALKVNEVTILYNRLDIDKADIGNLQHIKDLCLSVYSEIGNQYQNDSHIAKELDKLKPIMDDIDRKLKDRGK